MPQSLFYFSAGTSTPSGSLEDLYEDLSYIRVDEVASTTPKSHSLERQAFNSSTRPCGGTRLTAEVGGTCGRKNNTPAPRKIPSNYNIAQDYYCNAESPTFAWDSMHCLIDFYTYGTLQRAICLYSDLISSVVYIQCCHRLGKVIALSSAKSHPLIGLLDQRSPAATVLVITRITPEGASTVDRERSLGAVILPTLPHS